MASATSLSLAPPPSPCPAAPRRGRHLRLFYGRYFFAPLHQSDSRAGLGPYRDRRVCCSVSSSWGRIERSDDGVGGWFVEEPESGTVDGASGILLVGLGSSIAIALACLAYVSFARKGFKFQFRSPIPSINEIFRMSEPAKLLPKGPEFHSHEESETEAEAKPVLTDNTSALKKDIIVTDERKRKIVSVAVDSTQQEAVTILQKLKIIENDVNPHELCTKREYARWLVKANSSLERNPRHRIVPSALLAVSTLTAFDDVDADDPDYYFIQAIGEAGIIQSKLSARGCTSSINDDLTEYCMFSPESYISRSDLISWKAQLEYPLVLGVEEKMLRKSAGFTDLGKVNLDALQGLFMDTLAGERSIARRAFGNIRRLQPFWPVTKAQAAVALTSGRMIQSVQIEFSRLQAEEMSRLADSKDIRSELIEKGEIPRLWEGKINDERSRALVIQHDLLAILQALEEEKIAYEKEMADHVKERAALDCQRQLLFTLKEEIDRMHERLAIEEATLTLEKQRLQELTVDLQERQNAVVEAKSVLEAEKEALRILRSWVEDGARRSQFRSRILEDAVQRWKWDDQAGFR